MRNITQIDLNLLVVFERVFSEGGVSPAARALNLSQPTISHALTRLRHLLGDQLYIRSGNRLVPTPVARRLIGPVRAALEGLNHALLTVGQFDPATSTRHFVIGLRHFSEAPNYPALAARVAHDAPDVRLSSRHFNRRTMVDDLLRGNLDLAFDLRRPSDPDLRSILIERDRLVVVARPGHPAISGSIDLETYTRSEHVVATPRAGGPNIEDLALARLGFRRNVVMRCQHAWTAWQLVARSDMICTLPRSYASAMSEGSANQLVALPFEIEPNEQFLYWHAAADGDPGLIWLRDLILENFSDLPSDERGDR